MKLLESTMRSLTFKLTLAFLIVGLTGAVLVASFVGLRTQQAFDLFVLDRYQVDLVERLGNYFERNGSWQGVGNSVLRLPTRPVVLADANRVVRWAASRTMLGHELRQEMASRSIPIKHNGEVIGLVLFLDHGPSRLASRGSPEADFIRRLREAVIFGAMGAALIALILGIILARSISGPVRELTAATKVIAQGELGHQVQVRTQDELGELAESFNQMSQDLARASQLRRQMSADIAHELRTPLSVIMGYTEALSDGKLHGSPEMYDAMHGEVRLLGHLIDDLRILSLADAGELPLHRRPTAPVDLLERTAVAYGGHAAADGITLQVGAAQDMALIDVDPDRMAQVLGNLVSNALRHTAQGGTVLLSGSVSGDNVILSVQDSGSGIEPEHLPNIFKRFYRADEARTGNGESGLGLAIAKSIVEAHGGSILAENVPGAGARFSIVLPTADTG
ncbi:MAG: ATP-binding protein [Chloroflexota bacterium]|nr:ATP-binding protein [Chloroflexota bacterium]